MSPRGCGRTLGVVLVLAGGAMLAKIATTAVTVFEAQSWHTAQGVVEPAAPDARDRSVVTYRFSVGDRVYRGSVVNLGAYKAGAPPPGAGDTVTVHYDPERPDRCALHVADRWVELALCGVPLVMFIVPGLLLVRLGGRAPMPPPDAAVAPRPGCATWEPGAATNVEPGRVGRSRLRVEAWQPGRTIRIVQKWSWKPWWLVIGLALVAAVFLFVRSTASETSRGEAGGPVLVWGLVILAPAVLLSRPSRTRVLTLDWPEDAIRVRRGRRERLLGLRRARAVELRPGSAGGDTTHLGHMGTTTSHWHELIVWIEPDGGEPVPYLLLSTEERGAGRWPRSEVEALEHLAEAMASELAVPVRESRDAPAAFE